MRSQAIDVRRLSSSLAQLGSQSKAANGSAVGLAAIFTLLPSVAELKEEDATAAVGGLLGRGALLDPGIKAHATRVAHEVIQRAKARREEAARGVR